MIKVALLIVLAVWPVKPDTALRFNNISITQALSAARMMGVKLELPEIYGKPIQLQGRIIKLSVELRGNIVYAEANGFNLSEPGEPWIRWVKIWYNRKTDAWSFKAEMFGGFVEGAGVILPTPKEPTKSRVK